MDGRPGNRSRGAAGRLFRLSRNVAGVGNSYGRTRLFLCDPFATLESQLAIQPSLSPVATLFSLACRFRIRSFDVVVKAARRSNPSGARAAEASGEPTMSSSNARTINRLLWVAQIVVALLFVFAGSMKFIMPAAKLQQGPVVLPIAFIHFIGICECLGALGLVLPGVLRFQTWLTP